MLAYLNPSRRAEYKRLQAELALPETTDARRKHIAERIRVLEGEAAVAQERAKARAPVETRYDPNDPSTWDPDLASLAKAAGLL